MPEKVGALTPLGVKSGKYNGTSKKRGGVKSGHFPSHFYYTTGRKIDHFDLLNNPPFFLESGGDC